MTGVTRKLAAILAADVAGYSKLMGADETGTLNALRKLRNDLFCQSALNFDPPFGTVEVVPVDAMGPGSCLNDASFVICSEGDKKCIATRAA